MPHCLEGEEQPIVSHGVALTRKHKPSFAVAVSLTTYGFWFHNVAVILQLIDKTLNDVTLCDLFKDPTCHSFHLRLKSCGVNSRRIWWLWVFYSLNFKICGQHNYFTAKVIKCQYQALLEQLYISVCGAAGAALCWKSFLFVLQHRRRSYP